MGFYERFRWAEGQFEDRDYRGAARTLEALLADIEREPEQAGHTVTDVRLLLARAYYHSAQLRHAEEAARALLADNPTEAYAALLLARTLQRANRPDEARQAMNLAAALGAPGTSWNDTAG
jgi:Flp pilus assembly protein TadD